MHFDEEQESQIVQLWQFVDYIIQTLWQSNCGKHMTKNDSVASFISNG